MNDLHPCDEKIVLPQLTDISIGQVVIYAAFDWS